MTIRLPERSTFQHALSDERAERRLDGAQQEGRV